MMKKTIQKNRSTMLPQEAEEKKEENLSPDIQQQLEEKFDELFGPLENNNSQKKQSN